jgi:hypothetical protein
MLVSKCAAQLAAPLSSKERGIMIRFSSLAACGKEHFLWICSRLHRSMNRRSISDEEKKTTKVSARNRDAIGRLDVTRISGDEKKSE